MKMALGTVQFGKEYGIQKNGRPSPNDSVQLITSAVKMGISAIDTAAAYGSAESIIGECLNGGYIERSPVSIITKLPPAVLNNIPASEYAAVLGNEVEKSLGKLKTDFLDGLLFHDANYVFRADAIDALIKIRFPGYINQVGISVYTPEEAIKALEYDIDIIQVPYNILDRRLDNAGFFKQAMDCGITVYARSALLQGLLTMAPDKIPVNMRNALPYIQAYNETCKELQLTPLECAIMYASSHPYIDYMVLGIDNAKQLEEVGLAHAKKMDAATYEYLYHRFSDIPDRVIMPNLWPMGA